MNNALWFRDYLAGQGVECTPVEAEGIYNNIQALRKRMRKNMKQDPNFALRLANQTTEEKLDNIAKMKEEGLKITLKEYNEIQDVILHMCEA